MRSNSVFPIGELAARTGLSVSAIRFYETRKLIEPFRSTGGQRRFLRSDIRRPSLIRIAQQLGLSIDGIATELSKLPHGRTPNAADWAKISRTMKAQLNDKIDALIRTRDLLDGCIGCGCLSLKKCALYNPQDRAALNGSGPRYVLGDLLDAAEMTISTRHQQREPAKVITM
jgi:MerR family transcriptional regulator, redox-sensitive transcriptional activator SoxR